MVFVCLCLFDSVCGVCVRVYDLVMNVTGLQYCRPENSSLKEKISQ